MARAISKIEIFQNKEITGEIQNKMKEKIPKNETESVEEEWKIYKKKYNSRKSMWDIKEKIQRNVLAGWQNGQSDTEEMWGMKEICLDREEKMNYKN